MGEIDVLHGLVGFCFPINSNHVIDGISVCPFPVIRSIVKDVNRRSLTFSIS